jgi:hypothetical protein
MVLDTHTVIFSLMQDDALRMDGKDFRTFHPGVYQPWTFELLMAADRRGLGTPMFTLVCRFITHYSPSELPWSLRSILVQSFS